MVKAPLQFRIALAGKIEASGLTTTEVARWLSTDYVTVYRWLEGINVPKKHHQTLILLAMDHHACTQRGTKRGRTKPNGATT